jgi:dephospho-CoA kinase
MDRTIFGLVGPIASGKQVLADFLKERGFRYISLSDEVREEALDRGLATKRENLQNVGNSLRREFGLDILAVRALAKIDPETKLLVVDSIRNVGEISYLRRHLPIKIIGIDAPAEIRMGRFLARALVRHEDGITAEDFWKADRRDRGENTTTGQQVDLCLLGLDIVIDNQFKIR